MRRLLFLFLLLLVSSCEKTYKVETRVFPRFNKTEYIFSMNKELLRVKLLELFSYEGQYRNPIEFRFENQYSVGFQLETKENMFFRKDILNIDGNRDDLILGVDRNAIWLSEYYMVNGEDGKVMGEFHIHLIALSDSSTKVQVNPVELKVINGSKCCNPHSGFVAIKKPIDSSSIEEYILLHHIGTYLGVKMPDILRP